MSDDVSDQNKRKRETRTRACLLLFDANQRVLLLRHTDGSGRQFWATPGGGVELGETIEQAARREAAEELGAKDVELKPLWTGLTQFQFADRDVSQQEQFFLITKHREIREMADSDLRRGEGILEARWWSLDDLAVSSDVIFPVDLVESLHRHRDL